MSDIKTEQLGLRITPTAKALLRVAAEREHRSASNMVEHLILDHCERNNIVLEENPFEIKSESANLSVHEQVPTSRIASKAQPRKPKVAE